MDACCCPPAVEAGARACPACGEQGAAVRLQTVKALLAESALRRVLPPRYRFCSNPACDVVYFGDAGDCFHRFDVRVPVCHKEPVGARLLCYCFGETESGIQAELLERGHSAAGERIREHIRAGRCACDIRNPRGACCLGDVTAALTRMETAMRTAREP
jgi:hypothetical protein